MVRCEVSAATCHFCSPGGSDLAIAPAFSRIRPRKRLPSALEIHRAWRSDACQRGRPSLHLTFKHRDRFSSLPSPAVRKGGNAPLVSSRRVSYYLVELHLGLLPHR